MSEVQACLHLVCASPSRSTALQHCLSMLLPGDAVLLLDDGVNALLDGLPASLLEAPIELACLTADLEARGIMNHGADCRAQLLDDDGFVELVERYPLSQTWT